VVKTSFKMRHSQHPIATPRRASVKRRY